MASSDEDDPSAFITELNAETDRGLALVGAAVIDDRLGEVLRAFFCDAKASERLLDGDRGLGTFSARADACLALGLIEKSEYQEILIIRKVRNAFAHAKHGLTFLRRDIRSLCEALRSETSPPLPGPKFSPKSLFKNAVLQIVVRLYRRPEMVARERRVAKPWVERYQVKWGGPAKATPTRVQIVEVNRHGDDYVSTLTAEIKSPSKDS